MARAEFDDRPMSGDEVLSVIDTSDGFLYRRVETDDGDGVRQVNHSRGRIDDPCFKLILE